MKQQGSPFRQRPGKGDVTLGGGDSHGGLLFNQVSQDRIMNISRPNWETMCLNKQFFFLTNCRSAECLHISRFRSGRRTKSHNLILRRIPQLFFFSGQVGLIYSCYANN